MDIALTRKTFERMTEANLQISLSLHKNNVPKVLHRNSIYFFEIYAPEIYEMYVYKHTETIEYVKKKPNF